MLTALVLIVLVLVTGIVYSKRKAKNLPPGPEGWPFIGQTFSIDWQHQDRTFLKWGREYGPIFKVTAGQETIIVLSDPELIREAFSGPLAVGRRNSSAQKLIYADKGIIFTNGELWKHSRRFTLFHLRNFGMGREKSIGMIHDQINGLLDEVIAPSEGEALSLDLTLNTAVLNILWGMLAGESLSIKDSKVLKIVASEDEFKDKAGLFFLAMNVPALMKLPDRITGISKITKVFQYPVDQLLQPALDEHRRTVDLTGEPRDYIDCLLQEQSRNPTLFTDRHLLRCMLDLFQAGFDTTASLLRWAFCYLCSYPGIQERVHAELSAVIVDDREPTLSDRPRLPYTEAFLMETQRLSNLAGIGLAHVSTAEFQLAGYTVPRGAQVISNLSGVHLNEKYFPQPTQFRPERFLDDGGKVKPNRALMPFAVGKRACLGESLARSELFLFVTSVVQKYRLRFPAGFSHDFSINESKAFINDPKPYQLIPEKR